MKTNKNLLLITGLALIALFCNTSAMTESNKQPKQQFVAPCWSTGDKYKIIEFAKAPSIVNYNDYAERVLQCYNFIFDESVENLHFNVQTMVYAHGMMRYDPTYNNEKWVSINTLTGAYKQNGGETSNHGIRISTYTRPLINLIDVASCKQIFSTIDTFNKIVPLESISQVTQDNFSGACTTPDDATLFVFLKNGTILKVLPVRVKMVTRSPDIHFNFA